MRDKDLETSRLKEAKETTLKRSVWTGTWNRKLLLLLIFFFFSFPYEGYLIKQLVKFE